MDIRAFVHDVILSVVEGVLCDQRKFMEGIDAYIGKNAFYELEQSFDDLVTQRVIENNLSDILERDPKEIVLFFSNYLLLEDIRMINNKSLAFAKKAAQENETIPISEILDVENQFQHLLKEVYQSDELTFMLKSQISEIVLNLDHAKQASPYYGRRLRDVVIK